MGNFEGGRYPLPSRPNILRTNEPTRRGHSRVLLVLLLSMASAVCTHAQTLPPSTSDDEMGEQAYQSYHGGDIDSVGLTNGTLTINFPFLSYPQRGKLHLSFNLMYNNQPQHAASATGALMCGNEYCKQSWGYPLPSGLPIERGDVYAGWADQMSLYGTSVSETVSCNPYKCTTYYPNWSLQMADGSKHPVGNMGTMIASQEAGCNPPYTDCLEATGPFETLDASGWRLNGSLNPCIMTSGPGGCTIPITTVIDPNGVAYSPGTAQDPNGNQITSNATMVSDSLGRQVPWPPNINSTAKIGTTNCPVVGGATATYAVLWTVPAYNGASAQYTFCYGNVNLNLPSADSGLILGQGSSVVTKLQSIVLPNGQSWQFQYNDSDGTIYQGSPTNFGTLSQITLPTSGTISYTYGYGGTLGCQDYGRSVVQRTVNANDGSGPHTWTYTYSPGSPSNTVVTDPLGNDVVHTFGLSSGSGCQLYETQTQYYQGSHSSGTPLKTVTTAYSYSTGSPNTWPNGFTNLVPTVITTLWAASQETSEVTKSYDAGYSYESDLGGSLTGIYGKEISESDYDYPSGTSLLRTTNTSYAWQSPNPNYSSYLNNNLLDLAYSVQVKDSSGTQRAYTYYGYDESSLQSSGITEQKVAGESYPGNQTSVHRWLNGSTTTSTNCNVAVTNGYLVSNKAYFDTGEVQKNTDPCTYPTTYAYSPTYYGAFPTTVTNALSQVTTYGYDFNTGAVTSIQDANSQTTTKNYDILTRPISISFPDGGSTTACYTDMGGGTCTQSGAPYQVVVTKAITSSLNKTSTVVFDGLGRASQTQLNSDPSGTTYTLTTYDADGRKSQVYNPTRCSPITTNCGETTWGYTTTNYDALSRVTSVVEQDTSSVSTSYAAFPCTTVTDESGKSRKSCVDGLGRMTGVWEDPSGVNYETDYQYDALGNLTYVNQKGNNAANARTRTFQYDSLSELTSAVNPESGTILYAYDADGNLITKTAPLPNQTSTLTVTTTNTYDKLNRLTGKGYKDGTTNDPYTPPVQFGYDGVALTGCTTTPPGDTDSYPVGRRTAMCDGSGATSWKHDQMGRTLQSDRQIGAVRGDYETDAYNLAGLPISITTLGYSVGYIYSGTGSALSATNYSGGTTKFVSAATYAPPGQLAGMTLGATSSFTGIVTNNAYNDRLQPILLSAAVTGQSPVFSECFDFHLGVAVNTSPCSFSAYTSGDNGNVYQIVNNRNTARSELFTYDSLNRIYNAQSNGSQWGETFTIDPWGNMTNETAISGKTNHEGLNTTAGLKNQLAGFGYDAAGNMTSNGSVTYVYDAENRLIATGGYSYIYDGDGQRVEKCTEGTTPGTCATGATGTLYWRGLSSDALSETNLAGTVQNTYVFFNGQRVARLDSAGAVHYYFSDHLGSHGVVENATGTTCEQDIDYYPYGGVENDYCGGSGAAQNYKFTSKERDAESGLDYFGRRHHGSNLGRFMSVDRVIITPARLHDPQRLNLYGYGRNSPLSYIDVNGEDIDLVNDTQAGRDAALKKLTQGMSSAEAANIDVRQDKNGNWQTVVKDKSAVSMKDASVAYKGVVGVINDHSVTVNVGLVGGGLTATFPGLGKISSQSEPGQTLGSPGDRNVNVLVTAGSSPNVQVSTPYGVIKVPSPDFVTLYHETVGETLKYRAGHASLQANPMLDSSTVIKIENELRESLGMYSRTGSDHGPQVITVDGGSSK
jgi:RHS repeat-associated protein